MVLTDSLRKHSPSFYRNWSWLVQWTVLHSCTVVFALYFEIGFHTKLVLLRQIHDHICHWMSEFARGETEYNWRNSFVLFVHGINWK
jgi:hypothetical protein